ncbi:MAG: hypothetical protein K6F92_04255 [Lachnospiraceae bacterium]|nr:hypothetical protein [Lachnospiraceae bacterium]
MLLIIGGCINVNPDTPVVAIRDMNARLEAYVETVMWALDTKTFDRIVFCENSNYNLDVTAIDDKAAKCGKKFEYLTFMGDTEKVKQLGKGYGEGQIIEYALNNSELVKSYEGTHFCKITGRLTIENVDKLLPRGGKLSQAYFIDKTRVDEVDTRFYCCDIEFYKRVLLHCHERVNDSEGYYLEESFFDALYGREKFHMFMQRPLFRGVSGTMGKTYEDKRSRFEFLFDFLCVTNLYNNRKFRKLFKKKH